MAKKVAKKKVKKVLKKKALKVKKGARTSKAAKGIKAKKAAKKIVAKAPVQPKEKVLGKVEHYFDKISVAAISVKAPFQVGDIIHIKGHTTDFVQRVDSIQIEHSSVDKVKKGDDIGIKVKDYVRQHDTVYLSNEKALASQPSKPASAQKPMVVQQPMFPQVKPLVKPQSPAVKPAEPLSKPPLLDQNKPGYSEKKFFSF